MPDATSDDLVAPGTPHLPTGSRAIGAGVSSDVDHDIDGDPREGRWDVGADQFIPSRRVLLVVPQHCNQHSRWGGLT